MSSEEIKIDSGDKPGKNTSGFGKSLLMAAIADEDTITGLLLAGIGQQTAEQQSSQAPRMAESSLDDGSMQENQQLISQLESRNFYICDPNTPKAFILQAFNYFTTVRTDIAVLLITQEIANEIRPELSEYHKNQLSNNGGSSKSASSGPPGGVSVLEIPGKQSKYDVEKDEVVRRIRKIVEGS